MFVHLGEKAMVKCSDIIGIFDLEKTTIDKETRLFLKKAEEMGNVINVSMELPRSFVVCAEKGGTKVYISQISPATLFIRSKIFLK